MWMLILVPDYLAHQGWSAQKIGWAMGLFFVEVKIANAHAETARGNYFSTSGEMKS